MLKSYEAIVDHDKIQWLSEPPAGERFRVLVVVEQPEPSSSAVKKKRLPPPELKNSVQYVGDITESLFPGEEWEAMFERTAHQLEDAPKVSKASTTTSDEKKRCK